MVSYTGSGGSNGIAVVGLHVWNCTVTLGDSSGVMLGGRLHLMAVVRLHWVVS